LQVASKIHWYIGAGKIFRGQQFKSESFATTDELLRELERWCFDDGYRPREAGVGFALLAT